MLKNKIFSYKTMYLFVDPVVVLRNEAFLKIFKKISGYYFGRSSSPLAHISF
jgi:hypothetical protein